MKIITSIVKTTALTAFALACVTLAHSAFAAQPSATAIDAGQTNLSEQALMSEQGSGGWGQNCQTQQITCTQTGRPLACQATVGDASNRSECLVHWGDSGWVSCRVYDPNGNILVYFNDQCP